MKARYHGRLLLRRRRLNGNRRTREIGVARRTAAGYVRNKWRGVRAETGNPSFITVAQPSSRPLLASLGIVCRENILCLLADLGWLSVTVRNRPSK